MRLPSRRQALQFSAPLLFVAVLLALLGYGCRECIETCQTYGERWHWSQSAPVPPMANACTCIAGDGLLRRRRAR